MNKPLALAAAAAILTLAAVLVLRPDAPATVQPTGIPHTDPAMVAEGARVYAAQCAACHGAALEGAPDWRTRGADGLMPAPPHDASGHTWHHPDAVLIDLVTRGPEAVIGQGYRSAMPGYEGTLDPREIRAVLAYIKSTWPPEVIATHDRINAEN